MEWMEGAGAGCGVDEGDWCGVWSGWRWLVWFGCSHLGLVQGVVQVTGAECEVDVCVMPGVWRRDYWGPVWVSE